MEWKKFKFSFIVNFMICTSCLGQAGLSFPSYESIPSVEQNDGPGVQLPKGIQVFTIPAGKKLGNAALPQISQYTTTALPGESVIIMGYNFTQLKEKDPASDSGFLLAYVKENGQKNMEWLTIKSVENDRAIVTVPAGIPFGAYILWPVNKMGYGKPVILNSPEAWWIGPQTTYPGSIMSIYGKNLSRNLSKSRTAWVYARKKGASDKGVWLQVINTNNYKVDITIPSSFQIGEYECWVHNGYLGNYGWSGPKTFKVENKTSWNGNVFNVKDPEFAARGNGIADDWLAINNCIKKAASSPNSTVYFPAGTYKVNKGFNAHSNVRWLGEGKNKVSIVLGSGFSYNPQDASQYTLVFNNEGHLRCENVVFENIDFSVQKGTKGSMDALIYIRGARKLLFKNCSVKGAENFGKIDLASSREIEIKNCEFSLSGFFFAHTKQVSIDSIVYNGILDCNVMLEFWGSNGVSVTNSIGKDLDNSPTGQSKGRFLYGNNVWGSNVNIYASNNTTIKLAPRNDKQVDQNSGEQYSWELSSIIFKGKANSFSPDAVVVNQLNVSQKNSIIDESNGYGLFVINGKGVGQFRYIKSFDQNKLMLSRSWDVIPDNSSTVMITTFSANCVLYKNSIQGKSERVRDNLGSSGIQLYTNCMNFIVDGNRISDVVTGISTWSHIGGIKAGMANNDFCYFNEFINNVCTHVRIGAAVHAANWYKEQNQGNELYLGNIFRKNQFENCIEANIFIGSQSEAHENIALSVFENNKSTGSKEKLKVSIPGLPENKNLNEQEVMKKVKIYNNN